MNLLVFIAVFLGVLLRVLSPFIRKLKEAAEAGQTFKWEQRYTVLTIISLIVAAVGTLLILPTVPVQSTTFPVAFALGWAATDVVGEVSKYLSPPAPKPPVRR